MTIRAALLSRIVTTTPAVSLLIAKEFMERCCPPTEPPYPIEVMDAESDDYCQLGLLARCRFLGIELLHEGDTLRGCTSLRVSGLIVSEQQLTYPSRSPSTS
jgi:hypothetical protein